MADGLNVPRDGSADPPLIRSLGAGWIRIVAMPDVDLTGYFGACRIAGIKILLVLARESGGNYSHYRQEYGSLVDAVQVGELGRSQGPFHCPTDPDARPKTEVRNAKAIRPRSHRQRLATKRQDTVGRLILGLSAARCPMAILGAVGAIVVDPVESVKRGRSSPHVGQKLTERLPCRTDGDTSTPVPRVLLDIRIGTPLAHPVPNPILSDLVAQAMRRGSRPCALHSKASTRRRIAGHKRIRHGRRSLPTIALAEPSPAAVGPLRCVRSNNSQAPETLAYGDNMRSHREDSSPGVGPVGVASTTGLRRKDYTVCARRSV